MFVSGQSHLLSTEPLCSPSGPGYAGLFTNKTQFDDWITISHVVHISQGLPVDANDSFFQTFDFLILLWFLCCILDSPKMPPITALWKLKWSKYLTELQYCICLSSQLTIIMSCATYYVSSFLGIHTLQSLVRVQGTMSWKRKGDQTPGSFGFSSSVVRSGTHGLVSPVAAGFVSEP